MQKYIIPLFFSSFIGLCIPTMFAIVDLHHLELAIDWDNFIANISSQYIFIFCYILLPTLFSVLAIIFVNMKSHVNFIQDEMSFLKNILDNMPLIAAIYDHDSKLIISNQEFICFQKTVHPQALATTLQKSMKGRQQFEVKFDIHNHDQYYMIRSQVIHFNAKTYHLFIAVDITYTKEQEHIIQDQQDQIFEAAKLSAMGEMAGGFAHEINNPLTVICGNNARIEAYLRRKGVLDEKMATVLNKTNQMIFRITRIINGLRKLTRNQPMEKMAFPFQELFDEVVEMTKFRIQGKGITLIEVCEQNQIEVFTDRVLLGQIFINLLNNAIDAIDEFRIQNPTIKFSVEFKGENLVAKIQDNGPGVPSEIIDKIFNPMFTTKDVGKGTGLGLSLSRNIIHGLGGKLDYLGQMDGLTTFIVTTNIAAPNNSDKISA